MEHATMQKAIAESEEMFNRAHEEDKVYSLGELIGYLRSKEMKFWNIIEKEERLVIIHIVDDEAPWLKYSVCVKGDMSVTVHVMKTAVRKLGANLVVPEIADSESGIVQLLEGIEKWDGRDLMSDSVAEICEAVCLLLDQLSTPHAEDDGDCIRFLREQVSLFQAKKQCRRYSADSMVFCCILFTISPHAYAYIRSHGSIILPHPMTIRSVEALHPSCNVVVSSETLSKIQEVLPILVYVAGYAVYATLKRLNCAKRKDVLTVDKTITVSAAHEHYDLVKQLDRGGLLYPSMFALNAVAHCYVVVEKLATQPELLLMREQRQVVTELTLHLLANEEPAIVDTSLLTVCCGGLDSRLIAALSISALVRALEEYVTTTMKAEKCMSDECIRNLQFLDQIMHFGVDPCMAFHSYACGRFMSPTKYMLEKMNHNLATRAYERALEEKVQAYPPTLNAEQKAYKLFHMCLDLHEAKRKQPEALVKVLDELKLNPTSIADDASEDPLDRMMETSFTYGVHGIIEFVVDSVVIIKKKRLLKVDYLQGQH
ncbi:hypothetical protein MRX96_009850 [Rhipicephalus microplus]